MMSMRMSYRHSHRQTHRLVHRVRLRLASRLRLTLRLDLIQALRDERYEPNATCPDCGRKLTPIDILRGFNDDPRDFTTQCPNTQCGARFEARLIQFSGNDIDSRIEMRFFCEMQMLEQLRGLANLPPLELSKEHPAVYRSAIVHCGGIGAAFAKIGVSYPHEEISNWQAKATPFLGKLTDVDIASCAGVKQVEVRRLRRSLGIARYRSRTAKQQMTTTATADSAAPVE